jgi:hypothetical protein
MADLLAHDECDWLASRSIPDSASGRQRTVSPPALSKVTLIEAAIVVVPVLAAADRLIERYTS